MKHPISIKRAYEPHQPSDGRRILIDRMWPRGVRKEDAHIDEWVKDVAPSTELRTWFGHDPHKWGEFQERYTAELDANKEAWEPILREAQRGTVTLVYSAKDTAHNNAVALLHYLEGHLKQGKAAGAEH